MWVPAYVLMFYLSGHDVVYMGTITLDPVGVHDTSRECEKAVLDRFYETNPVEAAAFNLMPVCNKAEVA